MSSSSSSFSSTTTTRPVSGKNSTGAATAEATAPAEAPAVPQLPPSPHHSLNNDDDDNNNNEDNIWSRILQSRRRQCEILEHDALMQLLQQGGWDSVAHYYYDNNNNNNNELQQAASAASAPPAPPPNNNDRNHPLTTQQQQEQEEPTSIAVLLDRVEWLLQHFFSMSIDAMTCSPLKRRQNYDSLKKLLDAIDQAIDNHQNPNQNNNLNNNGNVANTARTGGSAAAATTTTTAAGANRLLDDRHAAVAAAATTSRTSSSFHSSSSRWGPPRNSHQPNQQQRRRNDEGSVSSSLQPAINSNDPIPMSIDPNADTSRTNNNNNNGRHDKNSTTSTNNHHHEIIPMLAQTSDEASSIPKSIPTSSSTATITPRTNNDTDKTTPTVHQQGVVGNGKPHSNDTQTIHQRNAGTGDTTATTTTTTATTRSSSKNDASSVTSPPINNKNNSQTAGSSSSTPRPASSNSVSTSQPIMANPPHSVSTFQPLSQNSIMANPPLTGDNRTGTETTTTIASSTGSQPTPFQEASTTTPTAPLTTTTTNTNVVATPLQPVVIPATSSDPNPSASTTTKGVSALPSGEGAHCSSRVQQPPPLTSNSTGISTSTLTRNVSEASRIHNQTATIASSASHSTETLPAVRRNDTATSATTTNNKIIGSQASYQPEQPPNEARRSSASQHTLAPPSSLQPQALLANERSNSLPVLDNRPGVENSSGSTTTSSSVRTGQTSYQQHQPRNQQQQNQPRQQFDRVSIALSTANEKHGMVKNVGHTPNVNYSNTQGSKSQHQDHAPAAGTSHQQKTTMITPGAALHLSVTSKDAESKAASGVVVSSTNRPESTPVDRSAAMDSGDQNMSSLSQRSRRFGEYHHHAEKKFDGRPNGDRRSSYQNMMEPPLNGRVSESSTSGARPGSNKHHRQYDNDATGQANKDKQQHVHPNAAHSKNASRPSQSSAQTRQSSDTNSSHTRNEKDVDRSTFPSSSSTQPSDHQTTSSIQRAKDGSVRRSRSRSPHSPRDPVPSANYGSNANAGAQRGSQPTTQPQTTTLSSLRTSPIAHSQHQQSLKRHSSSSIEPLARNNHRTTDSAYPSRSHGPTQANNHIRKDSPTEEATDSLRNGQSRQPATAADQWRRRPLPTRTMVFPREFEVSKASLIYGGLRARYETRVSFNSFTISPQDRNKVLDRLAEWEPYWKVEHICDVGSTWKIDKLHRSNQDLSDPPATATDISLNINYNATQLVRSWGKAKGERDHVQGDCRLLLFMLPVKQDLTHRADTHIWPIGTFLTLDATPIPLSQRKQQAHKPSEWLGNSKILDLTQHIKEPEKLHKIQVCCVDKVEYFYCLAICQYFEPEHLFDREKLVVVSTDEATKRALEFARPTVCLDSDDEGGTHEETGKLVFSLVCPISKVLLQRPVRGKRCLHFQCFELKTFLEINATVCGHRWRCGACEELVSWRSLQFCGLTAAMLEEFRGQASAIRDRVEFQANGQYKLLEENKLRYGKKRQSSSSSSTAKDSSDGPASKRACTIEIEIDDD